MSYEITPEDIERLDPDQFVHFVNRLIRAEAARLGMPPGSITTTDRTSGRDGGVDARVDDDDGLADGRWFPPGLSVWQFKTDRSRQNTQPNKLKQEAQKPQVKEALMAGGAYRIAIGRACDDRMRRTREDAVWETLEEMGVGRQNARVLTADHLAQWASEHPAMMLLDYFPIQIGNLRHIEHWERELVHSVGFVASDSLNPVIGDIRTFAQATDTPSHMRLEGRIGVGKTRLVLEALKDPTIRERVVYASRPDSLPREFWPWVRDHQDASVIIAVDNCDMSQAQGFAVQADLCGGRTRLITIGMAHAPLFAIPREYIFIDPLDDDCLFRILQGEYSSMAREQLDWIVRFTSGCPGLALACARALERDTATDISQVMRIHGIDHLLILLLPQETHRRALQAVSLLSRVGVEGEVKPQAEAMATFLDISWQDFCDGVAEGVALGLVARRGRYRYVTPDMLAAKLATEVWDARGEDTCSLLNTLPDDESRHFFLCRLKDVGTHQHVRPMIRRLFSAGGRFPDLESIDNPQKAQLFRELAFAAPGMAMRALERLLAGASQERLREFPNGRRWIVWTLEYLKWFTEYFHAAGRLLLSLAEAETEDVTNNATGVWIGLFSPGLGGTAVPAVDRLTLIEEALNSDSSERRLLAVRAIGKAVPFHETRMSGPEEQGVRPVPPEWRPTLWVELQEIGLSTLELLDTAIEDECADVSKLAREILAGSARMLVRWGLAQDVLARFDSLGIANDTERRELRDCVDNVLEFEASSLTPEQRTQFEELQGRLVGNTYSDRLRRWVGELSSGDQRVAYASDSQVFRDEMVQLAREAIESPELLLRELDWLTSDNARNARALGSVLGELDVDRYWFPKLEELAFGGQGILLLASYLSGRRAAEDEVWVEECLEQWAQQEPAMAQVVLQVTWASPPSAQGLQRILELVNSGWLDCSRLGSFYFGQWVEQLPTASFEALVGTLAEVNAQEPSEHALVMLEQRLQTHPEEHGTLAAIAWELLERTEWCAGNTMYAHYWHKAAVMYMEDDPLRCAMAILKLYERQDSPLLQHTPLFEVLQEAARKDLTRVWECISSLLIKDRKIDWGLMIDLEANFVKDLDHDHLLSWAQSNEPLGPIALAHIAPVEGLPMHPLARGLLVRYGGNDDVRSELYSSFQRGGYWGSTVGWLNQKLELARQWEQDSDPNVTAWASELAERITAEIEDWRIREEEWGLSQ